MQWFKSNKYKRKWKYCVKILRCKSTIQWSKKWKDIFFLRNVFHGRWNCRLIKGRNGLLFQEQLVCKIQQQKNDDYIWLFEEWQVEIKEICSFVRFTSMQGLGSMLRKNETGNACVFYVFCKICKMRTVRDSVEDLIGEGVR